MRVRSLGQEDPLEESMAIHSSILAWRIAWFVFTVTPQGYLNLLPCCHNLVKKVLGFTVI